MLATFRLSRRILIAGVLVILAFTAGASRSRAADEAISGNLTVTGTADIDGNTLTLGTQSNAAAASFTYANSDTDTLTFYLNRSPASFLWAHTSAISAMRLTSAHELVLYKSDGTTAGLTFIPAVNSISLGTTTLYRDAGSGALRTNGALIIDGNITAPNVISSNGSITGGASGLTINAGGTNNNITFSPSGTGVTVFNGKVGIGTSSPAGQLSINSSGITGPSFVVGSATRTDLIINSSGAIGLGISSADIYFTEQQASSSGGANGILMQGDAGVTRTLEIHNNYATGAALYTHADAGFRAPAITLSRSRGTLASPTAVQSTDRLGYVTIAGHTGSAYANSAEISSTATQNWTATAHGTNLFFSTTANDSTSTLERMRIDHNGNVGIGTITPASKLHIIGLTSGSPVGDIATFENNNLTDGFSTISVKHLLASGTAVTSMLGSDRIKGWVGTATNTPLALFTNFTEKVRIDTSGNMGIGTSTPTAKLHVAGNTNVTGTLAVTAGGRFGGPVRLEPSGDLSMGTFTSDPMGP